MKLIGATAQHVMPDLNERLIVMPEIERIGRVMTADGFVAAERGEESRVLACGDGIGGVPTAGIKSILSIPVAFWGCIYRRRHPPRTADMTSFRLLLRQVWGTDASSRHSRTIWLHHSPDIIRRMSRGVSDPGKPAASGTLAIAMKDK